MTFSVNLTANPYRGLSVQDVDFVPSESAVRRWIIGRRIYRRTQFIAVRHSAEAVLIAVNRRRAGGLFDVVEDVEVVAAAEELVWVDSPETDVGIASELATVAAHHRRAGIDTYVVTGRYRHVNFVHRPRPLRITVDEVVPPHPAKLYQMARQAVAFDEDLPPITLIQRLISIPSLIRRARGARHLLPCQGAGPAGHEDSNVDYLDAGPAFRDDWTLVGCRRSQQIYEEFYGQPPVRVDFCPELSIPAGDGGARLTKCCQLERGIRVDGQTAVVPWCATLDEVRQAIDGLAGAGDRDA